MRERVRIKEFLLLLLFSRSSFRYECETCPCHQAICHHAIEKIGYEGQDDAFSRKRRRGRKNIAVSVTTNAKRLSVFETLTIHAQLDHPRI